MRITKLLARVVRSFDVAYRRTRTSCAPVEALSRSRLLPFVVGSIAMILLVAAPSAFAFEIRQAGKLKVAPDARLFAFSTDPAIQEILSQDFGATSRSADASSVATVTVSVNVTQQMLRPGISRA